MEKIDQKSRKIAKNYWKFGENLTLVGKIVQKVNGWELTVIIEKKIVENNWKLKKRLIKWVKIKIKLSEITKDGWEITWSMRKNNWKPPKNGI